MSEIIIEGEVQEDDAQQGYKLVLDDESEYHMSDLVTQTVMRLSRVRITVDFLNNTVLFEKLEA